MVEIRIVNYILTPRLKLRRDRSHNSIASLLTINSARTNIPVQLVLVLGQLAGSASASLAPNAGYLLELLPVSQRP